MNLAAEYIKYCWNAKGRHGIHSPFVYDLVDKCFKTSVSSVFLSERSAFFAQLKREKRSIFVKDFGAGSKHFKAERVISKIAKASSSKGKFGTLLYQLAAHYRPKRMLEFGTSLGIGTLHLSQGNVAGEVHTVEADPATFQEAVKHFDALSCTNIAAVNATFDTYLQQGISGVFDLIFIDGHHDGTALLHYIQALEKYSTAETIFVLDDIRWSASMLDAWKSLVASDAFHVTIDLFRMGMLVRRPQQIKEHFVVRY